MKTPHALTRLFGLLLLVSMSIQPLEAVAQDQSCENIAPSVGAAPQWILDCRTADAAKGQAVADPANTFFGQEAVSDDLQSGLLGTPEVLTNLGGTPPPAFIGACDFAGADLSQIYCLDGAAGVATLFTIATDGSGTTTTVGTVSPFGSETFTSLDWDPTTGTMYATSTSISTGSLYTIDLGTPSATRIGALTAGHNCPIAGGFDNSGQMYTYDICTDAMYSVAKASGVATFIGPLGFNANFGQGMDFDPTDNTCQMFAFNASTFQPEMRICNTADGSSIFVGVIGSVTPGGLRQIGGGGVGAFGSVIDFTVDKSVNNDEPFYLETVTFTVQITNDGPGAATGVEVTDNLPAGLTYVSSSASQGSYDPGTGIWMVGALADGASATLTIDAVVNTLDPATNTATVTDSSPAGSGSDSATITPRAADLAIDKVVDNASPALGDNVTFTITIDHNDGADVTSVRVEDQLPAGLSFVSAATTQGTFNSATGNWEVGSMTEGQSETLTITAEVTSTEAITNVAFIAFSSEPDPFPGDNTDAASLNAIAADLEVSKGVTDFANEDGTITATYEVEVTNEGPSATGGVEVTDYLSADMTVVSITVSQGTVVLGAGTATWGVGTLADGASATMTITVTAPEGGNLLNTAEVTDADLPDPDSVPGDGEGDDHAAATASARVAPDFVPEGGPGGIIDRGSRFAADLALTKDVDLAGSTATYTIMIENLGPQSTAKVAATDVLPDCLTFTSASADKGSYNETTGVWTIGAMKVGDKVTLEIVTAVGADCSGTVTNTAEITSSSLPDPSDFFNLFDDPALANNSDDASFEVTGGREVVLDGTTFALGANYPNPFNPQTVIPFSLRETAQVSVKIYDLLGREVAVLVDGSLSAGLHEVTFDASQLPTGVYLVRFEAAGIVQTQRITLMK